MSSIPPNEWCGLLRQGHFNKSEIRFDHFQRATHYIARNIHVNSQARPRIGWHSAKQKNIWRSMFWTLLVTRIVRASSYETINLIGTHCVHTYRVYS